MHVCMYIGRKEKTEGGGRAISNVMSLAARLHTSLAIASHVSFLSNYIHKHTHTHIYIYIHIYTDNAPPLPPLAVGE
jgi:hypothetical protein